MKGFDSCRKIGSLIKALQAERKTIESYIRSPGRAAANGMPKSHFSDNDIERYLVKVEKYKAMETKLMIVRNREWRKLVHKMKLSGISEADRQMMKLRYFYGRKWKDCARILSQTDPEWNESKVYRRHNKIKKILQK